MLLQIRRPGWTAVRRGQGKDKNCAGRGWSGALNLDDYLLTREAVIPYCLL